jgi:DNA-directed RNA polymerase specialized sigma24 family protein
MIVRKFANGRTRNNGTATKQKNSFKLKIRGPHPIEPRNAVNALATSPLTLPPPADSSKAASDRRLELVTEAADLYHTHLLEYLTGVTGNQADAKDILQNLWRYVLLHFKENQIQQIGLLRRKAHQLFIDHLRFQKRRPEVVTDELPEVPADAGQQQTYSPDEEQRLKERFWGDYPGIDLTGLQKEALWRHARYGYTYAEISNQLNVPVSTVGDWIALCRKKLAAVINAQT